MTHPSFRPAAFRARPRLAILPIAALSVASCLVPHPARAEGAAAPESAPAAATPRTETRWAAFRANPYWRDRWLDLRDVFGLRVSGASGGRGAGILVRATALAQIGAVTFDGEHAGLDRRAIGVWRERRLQGALGPLAYTRIRTRTLRGNEFAGPDSDWAKATPRGIVRDGEYWDDGRERPFACGVELQPGILPGFEARFDPVELMDFLLGWATIDLYDDDPEAPAPLPEERVGLPEAPLDFQLPPRPVSGSATPSSVIPTPPPAPPASEAETLPELSAESAPTAAPASAAGPALLQESREEGDAAPPPVAPASEADSMKPAPSAAASPSPAGTADEPLERETFASRADADWMKPPPRAEVSIQELERMGVKDAAAVPEKALAAAEAETKDTAEVADAEGRGFGERVRAWFRRVLGRE